MDISPHHPFLKVEKTLTKICRPLTSHTPFGYFCYERFYHDGHYLALCLDAEYCFEIFKNEFLPNLNEMQKNNSHYVYLSPELYLPNAEIYKSIFNKISENISLSKQYKIYHRLCIIFNTPSYVEVFAFGITKHDLIKTANNVVETFMNYVDLLEKFCIYFREAATNLIEETKNSLVKFDKAVDSSIFADLNFKNTETYKDFISEIQLNKYSLQGIHNNGSLSKRELECLLWCVKNKTAKQIGKILSLSPRTVEDYLTKIKNKLGCQSKFELIDLARKNWIIKSLID